MIKIENLTKTYNKGKAGEVTALQGISCELPSSGMIFIVGRSGCGKSTLLNILGQLDGGDGGTVSIDGKLINNFTEDERADYRNHFVGFVFQEYNLIENYTVKENVEIALDLQGETEKDNKIAEALKLVELEGSEERKVNELSGGQKQRVAIARAVVKNPKLLLCDEPTGSLDSKTGALIFTLLKKLSKQNLVVVVSHDEEAAKKYADKIIELKDGEIVVGESNFFDLPQKQNIEEKKDERVKKKDKLPFYSKAKLGFDFLFGKPTRIIIALILCVVSFVLLSISSSFSMIDKNATLTNSLYENGIAWLSYKKTGYSEEENALYPLKMNDEDINSLQKELGTDSIALVYDFYTSVNFNFATDWAYININYYDDVANGFTEISQEFLNDYGFTLKGRLPQADDEVVITQYLFDMYKAYGYQNGSVKEKIEDYNDIFNKKITSTETGLPQLEMTIVGVVDTKFNTERYDVLLEKNPPENTSVLVNEIRTMMRQGLHNVLYFREGYYARNFAGRYDTQLVKGSDSFEVVKGDREYSYSGIRRAETLPEGKIYYHTDYDQANAQADFEQGKGVLLPSSSINVANVNNLISAFAMEHYYELDEEARKIYSTWYSYASYIKNSGNSENEYHPGKNYEYFFNEYLKQIFALFPVNGELTHSYAPEYVAEVTFIGFYDNTLIGADENILLVSNEVFEEFTWGLGEDLYDVAYATTPVTGNYKTDLAHVELAEKHIDEQVRVPGYNSYMTDYIFYNIENEATYSYINAKGLLDIFQTVFSWVSLGLGLLAVVFIYYHISGVIADKQKDIGILYALGTTKRDIVLIFLFGTAVFAVGIILISSILSGILTIVGNGVLMKQLYLLLPLFNFSVVQVLIVAVTTVIAVLIGVLFPLMRLTKKQPMELIRKL